MTFGRPQWWVRLGGPNAVSLPAWWLTLPGGVLGALMWLPTFDVGLIAIWMACAVLAHVVDGGILAVGWLTYLSPRPRPPRPLALLATLLVAGLARGLILREFAVQFGIWSDSFTGFRLVGAVIGVVVWYPLAALIVDGYRRHRDVMAQLVEQAATERALAERSVDLLRTFREDLVARTEATVTEQLQKAVQVSADPGEAAANLHGVVDEVVRPLSRELHRRSAGDDLLLQVVSAPVRRPRPPLRSYAVGMVTAQPFAPALATLLLVIAPLPLAVVMLGAGRATAALALAAALVAGALAGAKRWLLPRLRELALAPRAALVVGVWLLIAGASAGVVAALTPDGSQMPRTWMTSAGVTGPQAGATVTVLLTMLGMVVGAAVGAVTDQRQRAETELATTVSRVEWAAARLRQRAWGEESRFGAILHNDIQARIVSLALRMQMDPPTDPAAAVADLSAEVRSALSDPREGSWRQHIEDLRNLWCPAIEFSVSMAPQAARALDRDPVAGQAVAQIIGEAVTNAVRHGDADRVVVSATGSPGLITIRVSNDGTPVQGVSSGGLGSQLLDAATLDWELVTGERTTLVARVACEPMAEMVEA